MNKIVSEAKELSDAGGILLSDSSIQDGLNVAGIGVWSLDIGSGAITCNTHIYHLLGVDPSELFDFNRAVCGTVHPADRTDLLAVFDAVMEPDGPGSAEMEYRVVDSDDQIRWLLLKCHVVLDDLNGTPSATRLVCVLRDITADKELRERQAAMIEELNHRGKNMLSVVQSLAYQSFRLDPYASSLYVNFQGRLKALSRTHDLLIEEKFSGVFITSLLDRIATSAGVSLGHLSVQGFPIRLGPRQVVPFGLILHELVSNSLKYGALSVPDGRIAFNWVRNPASDLVRLVWTELDGPPVIEPENKGFGVRMIERAVALEFGGLVRFDYQPEGLECTLTVALNRLKGSAQ